MKDMAFWAGICVILGLLFAEQELDKSREHELKVLQCKEVKQ